MILKSIKIIILITVILIVSQIHYSYADEDAPHQPGEEGTSIFSQISRWLNFIALAVILYYFLARVMNIPDSYKKLNAGIAQAINSSAESKAAALKQVEEIKLKLANLESEIEGIRTEAIKNAELEKNKITAETELEAQRIREMAQYEIDWKLKEAIQNLKQHTIDIAASLSEQKIKSALNDSIHEQLIEKFITDLRNKN